MNWVSDRHTGDEKVDWRKKSTTKDPSPPQTLTQKQGTPPSPTFASVETENGRKDTDIAATARLEKRTQGEVSLCYRKKLFFLANAKPNRCCNGRKLENGGVITDDGRTTTYNGMILKYDSRKSLITPPPNTKYRNQQYQRRFFTYLKMKLVLQQYWNRL